MPRFILADSAKSDINEILTAIIPENENAAWEWYFALQKTLGTLAHSPLIGRVRDELLPEVRMFPFGNYLIFYDVIQGGIQVVHVVHGARDVRRMFAQDNGIS
ncbi:MAG: type II toxin-antitoxin system RelE/ParE family toxin [Rhodospirillales bacterium]|nr:type II toxin-antitoxin system RelE/ParE family toxin [Rhodospirillales bacterium]